MKSCLHAPTGIRTLVLALKGLRPGPLDDGGIFKANAILPFNVWQVKKNQGSKSSSWGK